MVTISPPKRPYKERTSIICTKSLVIERLQVFFLVPDTNGKGFRLSPDIPKNDLVAEVEFFLRKSMLGSVLAASGGLSYIPMDGCCGT